MTEEKMCFDLRKTVWTNMSDKKITEVELTKEEIDDLKILVENDYSNLLTSDMQKNLLKKLEAI